MSTGYITFSCSSRSLTTPPRCSLLILPFSAIVNPGAQQEMVLFETPKQSSGVVVSPKEVFMNAAAAIPETRSGRSHQWGSDKDPHFRK